MAKEYLLAFEDLCFEASHSPQSLALARMLPPPVASVMHWVHYGTAAVVNLALIPAEAGSLEKMCSRLVQASLNQGWLRGK